MLLGTSISGYGFLNTSASTSDVVATFYIDNGTPQPFNENASEGVLGLYESPMFTSGLLSDGPHTLTMNTMQPNAQGCLWIDYLEISATPSEVQDKEAQTMQQEHKGLASEYIALIVLGCILLVLALLVGFLWRRRPRKQLSDRRALQDLDVKQSESVAFGMSYSRRYLPKQPTNPANLQALRGGLKHIL